MKIKRSVVENRRVRSVRYLTAINEPEREIILSEMTTTTIFTPKNSPKNIRVFVAKTAKTSEGAFKNIRGLLRKHPGKSSQTSGNPKRSILMFLAASKGTKNKKLL